MKQVSWVLKNLPALSREPQVSVIGGELPLLTATTEQKPMAFLSAQWEREADARLRTLAGKLTAGTKSDEEKVKALQSYVIDNLYYSPLPLSETAYRIRPTAEVLRSAYATEAEKANLLAADGQHPRTVCVDRSRRQAASPVPERQNPLRRLLAERSCLRGHADTAV